MLIKKVKARVVKDSRGEKTIQIIVKSNKGKFITSAPSGKSTGIYEAKPYARGLKSDIVYINKLNNKLKINIINKIIEKRIKKRKIFGIDESFAILKDIERLVGNKIGANTLFALEACFLKALAKENKKQVYEFLGKGKRLPRPVGNAVGGGLHSKGKYGKKPDFQEFLFVANGKNIKECIKINKTAYKMIGKLLKAKDRNDEGAWETNLNNKQVLELMNKVKEKIKKKYDKRIEIGLDVAGGSFYQKNKYSYKNPRKKLNQKEQINNIKNIMTDYRVLYVEDGLNEKDFKGFKKLKKESPHHMIVGDDLTVTNPSRFNKAIKMKSINSIIIKPNQIGSLLKMKKVIDIAKKHNIKTIISHRSGETMDNTIADLGVGWGCDFIKTGIYGSVREAKLKRLGEIENELLRK